MANDCNGRPVSVGTRVRVLKIASSLERDLPLDERADLHSMVGEVFQIDEIDEYGSAWIEKTWREDNGQSRSHRLSLDSDKMEAV
jgi:hypothetical protein